MPPAEYGKSSALPAKLNPHGNVLLPGFSNWFYNGTQNASAAVLIPAFSNATNWIGSDQPFEIESGASTFTTGLMMFVTCTCVLWSMVNGWM